MKLLLRYDYSGDVRELGPKTPGEWATPNGSEDSLLTWMLREIEKQGVTHAELVAVEEGPTPDYYAELRP